MQSLIMTVSIYTYVTMVSDGRFEAMGTENVTVTFTGNGDVSTCLEWHENPQTSY